MRIAITGANGQLGRELCRQLGTAAVPLSRAELDLRNTASIYGTLLRLAPSLLINCAAYTQVDQAQREPDLCRAVNGLAVAEMVRACRELDCPLLQVSTDYVFGGAAAARAPHRESEPTCPQGVYARTKLAGEEAAAGWQRHWIVRVCGLYADPAHAEARHFVATMLRLGALGRPLRIVADQHCAPSFVPHVAQAILYLAGVRQSAAGRPISAESGAAAAFGVYHVANTGQTTWYEFAREIFRQAGLAVSVEAVTTAQYAAAAPRPAYSVLDTARYHALGGPPLPSWQAALEEYFRRRAALGV